MSLHIASYPAAQLLFVISLQKTRINQVCIWVRFGYPFLQMDLFRYALLSQGKRLHFNIASLWCLLFVFSVDDCSTHSSPNREYVPHCPPWYYLARGYWRPWSVILETTDEIFISYIFRIIKVKKFWTFFCLLFLMCVSRMYVLQASSVSVDRWCFL